MPSHLLKPHFRVSFLLSQLILLCAAVLGAQERLK